MFEIIIFWLVFSIIVAIVASARGRSGGGWFLLSVILSPLLMLILVVCLPNLKVQAQLERANKPFVPDSVLAGVPYKAQRDGRITAMMQGGVVQFRSFDQFRAAVGGETKNEDIDFVALSRKYPNQTNGIWYRVEKSGEVAIWREDRGEERFPNWRSFYTYVEGGLDEVAIQTISENRPRLIDSPKFARGLAAVAIVGFVGFVAYTAAQRDKQQNPSPASNEINAKRFDTDANTVIAAGQLDQQWSDTFDKTGKYPEKQVANFHEATLQILSQIKSDSPSYVAAREVRERMLTRQLKISKVELANRPPQPQNPDITLGQVDMSYSNFKGSFTITNPNGFAIADVRVRCAVYGGSGTSIKDYEFTVYEVVPAKGKKSIQGYKFGYWPDQGKKVGCATAGYQRR
ncbi:hypothetical protein X566_09695 [Afipia sp. P52-10]|uniref:hypothetical protein n=1 Tax=Afipia sp. P52-10 TaxID=1429916 RepID=UPI0003DF3E4B|nr:hypothetical protein [Afipia sp. P52-10]ETR77897.1 hypothetical protein X566_09695 [Afipia sp. P52-10]